MFKTALSDPVRLTARPSIKRRDECSRETVAIQWNHLKDEDAILYYDVEGPRLISQPLPSPFAKILRFGGGEIARNVERNALPHALVPTSPQYAWGGVLAGATKVSVNLSGKHTANLWQQGYAQDTSTYLQVFKKLTQKQTSKIRVYVIGLGAVDGECFVGPRHPDANQAQLPFSVGGGRHSISHSRNRYAPIEIGVSAPTVESRLAALLRRLESLVRTGSKFDPEIVSSIDELLDEDESARTFLLSVARPGPSASATGDHIWLPRVRWFALEQLRHSPGEDYLETLIEAVEHWVEDEALYGAVVNVRAQKVNATQRARLREALRARLTQKADVIHLTVTVFSAQFTGQMLNTFASYAQAGDLELLGRFGLLDSAFAIRSNALEATRRVICRYPEDKMTEVFFHNHASELADMCRSCINFRRSSENAGSLLWSMLSILLGRFGDEAKLACELVNRYPQLRPDIRREIKNAATYLEKIGREGRLETQVEILRELENCVVDAA